MESITHNKIAWKLGDVHRIRQRMYEYRSNNPSAAKDIAKDIGSKCKLVESQRVIHYFLKINDFNSNV